MTITPMNDAKTCYDIIQLTDHAELPTKECVNYQNGAYCFMYDPIISLESMNQLAVL